MLVSRAKNFQIENILSLSNTRMTRRESMKKLVAINILVVAAMLLAACSAPVASLSNQAATALESAANNLNVASEKAAVAEQQKALQSPQAPVVQSGEALSLLAAYEGVLQNVYAQVNPSVVNIRVLVDQSNVSGFQMPEGFEMPELPFELPGLPGNPSAPEGNTPDLPQYGEGLGSGFVWDSQGHIVTNNHVVENAEKIEVTFADGAVLDAKLVGADPDSDLAVIKVDRAANELSPLQLANSDDVKVGQLAIAIGNPYGLEGTMTVGIISAMGRTMPAGTSMGVGRTYSIPDIIQTDAPINPGNSGGVLVDDQGQVTGVTFAIESTSGANAGIGFVIPSAVVQRVVPTLIDKGRFEHPYLGISGGTLVPSLAEAMNLQSDQRGVLVSEVVADGPADKAGLRGSEDEVTIDGSPVSVGGDVITAIDGQPIEGMDELISYLASDTQVGQKVTLTVLRNGDPVDVSVTLEARPTAQASVTPVQQEKNQQQANPQPARAWLGIRGMTLIPAIAQAMGLDNNQDGVLVIDVEASSPADEAGLKGSLEKSNIEGQSMMIGGDVIIAVNGDGITSMEDLLAQLQQAEAGQSITLTILRNGETMDLPVTLGERPTP
jgi:serine protease Do